MTEWQRDALPEDRRTVDIIIQEIMEALDEPERTLQELLKELGMPERNALARRQKDDWEEKERRERHSRPATAPPDGYIWIKHKKRTRHLARGEGQ